MSRHKPKQTELLHYLTAASSQCTVSHGSPFIAVALKASPLCVLPFEQSSCIYLPHLLSFSVQFLS